MPAMDHRPQISTQRRYDAKNAKIFRYFFAASGSLRLCVGFSFLQSDHRAHGPLRRVFRSAVVGSYCTPKDSPGA